MEQAQADNFLQSKAEKQEQLQDFLHNARTEGHIEESCICERDSKLEALIVAAVAIEEVQASENLRMRMRKKKKKKKKPRSF